MIIGFNATNILSPGGILHLQNILGHADPSKDNFSKVILWAPEKIIKNLPKKNWLELRNENELGKNIAQRFFGFLYKSNKLKKIDCDILFNLCGYNIRNFKPNILIIQNQIPFELSIIFKYRSFKMILRFLVLRYIITRSIIKSNGVIFLSNFSMKRISKIMSNNISNPIVISHGINKIFFNRKKIYKNEYYSFTNPMKFIYVSSLEKYKNHENLILAINEVKNNYPIHLTIIGNGQKADLKKILNLINQVNNDYEIIKHIKDINNTELTYHYNRSDACIYPSECETFGISLIESMAAGLPILSSNVYPMKEFIGPTGIYFNQNEVKDIVEKIIFFYENYEKRKKLSEEMYNNSIRFDWKESTRKTFSYIYSIYRQYQKKN